ncbi:MAG TPA: hypothetical protein PLK58_17770, partial [Candidatus Rifleibacterium sp.]|nr:hypothetical protein [Candidatus Rifleibacterium sp.]
MSFPVQRPRRLRQDSRLRKMIRQVSVEPQQLIYPLFVVEGLENPREERARPMTETADQRQRNGGFESKRDHGRREQGVRTMKETLGVLAAAVLAAILCGS